MGRHVMVVLTNPMEGREDEFNDWYSEVHLEEAVGVPGYVSAQRLKLSDVQVGEPAEYRYLAIYEIEADGAGAAVAELQAARATLTTSDALDPKRVMWFYEISEKVTA